MALRPSIHECYNDKMVDRIVDIASDPLQYDRNELRWMHEGSKSSPNRRIFLEYLQPVLRGSEGKNVLDIGCGLGWLCNEALEHGGRATGIDPSAKNIQAARKLYPTISYLQTSLQDYIAEEQFDLALLIMVETFMDLDAAFQKIFQLLRPGGLFVTIVSDFDRSTTSHQDYYPEIEKLGAQEAAIRIDSGKRFGVLCDIIRTVDLYERTAQNTDFSLESHKAILPKQWHPRYESNKGKPLFHLLQFRKPDRRRNIV